MQTLINITAGLFILMLLSLALAMCWDAIKDR